MTTTIVSPEVETPRHFADCDSLAIGRRIKALAGAVENGYRHDVTLADLVDLTMIDTFRGQCSCFALQLTRVEADLSARRKAQRAGFDHEAEIEQLITARTALRTAIGGAR